MIRFPILVGLVLPGAAYRWLSADAPSGPWATEGEVTAGPAQTSVQWPVPAGPSRQYYRLQLLGSGLP